MSLNSTKKIYLSIATFSILSICLILFIIYPLFISIKKSSEDLISQKQNILALETKIENLEKFQTIYQNLKPNLEKTDSLLIDPKAPIEFISFLETTSLEGQSLIKISPGLSTKTEKDPWPSLIFQITSTGSFPNFLKFLEKLETSSYLIEISNLNINRLTENEIRLKEFERFALGDVRTTFLIKVFTK